MEWKDLFKGNVNYGAEYEISNKGIIRKKSDGKTLEQQNEGGTIYSRLWTGNPKKGVTINIKKSLLDSGFTDTSKYDRTYKNKLISPYTTNVYLSREERDYIKDKVDKLIEEIIIDKNL